jgi:hypothetical protein
MNAHITHIHDSYAKKEGNLTYDWQPDLVASA